jgi:homotetrameric cytidine deaminase
MAGTLAASARLGRVRAEMVSLGTALAASHRNLEIKARDADPHRSLELALALGAEDRGEIVQRDTYFASAGGRLKLREQAPGEAELIEYRRADEAAARASDYHVIEIGQAEPLRGALDAALGTVAVVDKHRRLLLWEGVRIHLDEVEGLGSFLELEAPDEGGREQGKIERLQAGLGIADDALVAGSYAYLLLATPEGLLAAAETVMRNAYAPHSGFKVGAALRAPSGVIYTGANVENSAYPQSQCAEASAIGALVAAGEGAITAVAVVAEQLDVCPPCGGCRQRLAEFATPDTPVYLGGHQTTTLGELLPLSFTLER